MRPTSPLATAWLCHVEFKTLKTKKLNPPMAIHA